MTRSFKDWKSWRDGLRSCVVRAGATAITTQLTSWCGTNAVATLPYESFKNIGMNWKTALISLVVQFVFHCLFAAASYIQQNPDAQVITETVDTEISRRSITTQTTK